jgi:hypothetical protein
LRSQLAEALVEMLRQQRIIMPAIDVIVNASPLVTGTVMNDSSCIGKE